MSKRRTDAELRTIANEVLTDLQRIVIYHWLDGWSIRRIAIAMNRSEATIRGHRDAALRRLKPYIRKDAA